MIFRSAEEDLALAKAAYDSEFHRLVNSGAMSEREVQDWSLYDILDSTKFEKLKELWDRCQRYYAQTREGRAAVEEAAKDSPIVSPVGEVADTVNPLDASVRRQLGDLGSWKGPLADLAAWISADPLEYHEAFLRVRTSIPGAKAYEVLLADGNLGLEVVAE